MRVPCEQAWDARASASTVIFSKPKGSPPPVSATPVLSSHIRKREDDEGRHTGPYESMPFTGSERPLIECPHGLVCLNTWFLVGGAVLESHGSFRR